MLERGWSRTRFSFLFLLAAMTALCLQGMHLYAGVDVRANQDPPGQHQQEVDISVDQSTGMDIVCMYIEDPRTSSGASVSHDMGVTWMDYQLQFGCDGLDNDGDFFIDEETFCDGLDDDGDTRIDEDTCCTPFNHIDPAVTSDNAATFTTIAIAYQSAPWFRGSSYVVVHQSNDGGVTWRELPYADISGFGPDNNGDLIPDNTDFLDKCWIVADQSLTSTYHRDVYAAWQRDTAHDCDGVDNDGDFFIDEELCNGIDDDGDILIDEDNCCLRTNANTHVWVNRWDFPTNAWQGRVRINDIPAGQCNFVDEDGDGQMDEELCNGLDDDGDGSLDEDLCCLCAEAPTPVVAQTGRVYVVWRQNAKFCGQPARFLLDFSDDGGATWQTDRPGPTYMQIGEFLRNQPYRTSDFPIMAVNPNNAQEIFVVYAEDPPSPQDEADAMFTWSWDAGNTWAAPIRINDDTTVTPQYWPTLSVQGGLGGNAVVDIVYYDQRLSVGCNGLDDDFDGQIDEEALDGTDNDFDGSIDEDVCNINIDVYWRRSIDQGNWVTFSPSVRVTDVSFPPPTGTNFLGDYLGIDSSHQQDYIAWADTRGPDNDIYFDIMPDVDTDGDGQTDLNDCVPQNAAVWYFPKPVQNVLLSKLAGNVLISWTSQDPTAGTGTGYDIVTGLISHLRTDTNFTRSTCLVNQHPNTPYTDVRTGPTAGDSYYYLIRATNTCGTGGYGSSPQRIAIDGNNPCPIP